MRKLIAALLLLASLLASGSTSSDNPKTVHVQQYKRKDGTVVRAHNRSAPGTASHRTTTIVSRTPAPSSGAGSLASTKRDSRGRIERSSSAKRTFEASHPCPGTGSTSGPCKGYVIDHVKPLACGGADAPENMQWQTAAAATAKDKVERTGCKAP